MTGTLPRPRTLVKFCGMTQADDLRMAADLGAAAVGFVFWPKSPRAVTPERARDLVRSLPAFVVPVGLFVNQPVEEIRQVVELVGLGVVQLHGDEGPEMANALMTRVIKAIGEPGRDLIAEVVQWNASVTLLIDAIDPERRGGTGQLADWTVARALAARRRVVLAGGLTPENVGQAVTEVRPYAVDVSSGVELRPGVKNHSRMRAFMEAVEAASAPPLHGGGAATDHGARDMGASGEVRRESW